jgi:hypothetical protein
MNKEQQGLLDEAYKNYRWNQLKSYPAEPDSNLTEDEFIARVITNPDFAKQWGVTIYTVVEDGNIRIGVNYNNKTIESHE